MAGGPVDLLGHDRQQQNSGKPKQARGVVSRAPSGVGDQMVVNVIGFGHYPIPGSNWDPKWVLDGGGGDDADWIPDLPDVGDHCCVIFDHHSDAWVGSLWGHYAH